MTLAPGASKLRRKHAKEIMDQYTRRCMVYRQHPRSENPQYFRWLDWYKQWILTCTQIVNKE